MITLLSKLFIKEDGSMTQMQIRTRYGLICSILGIVFNILLGLIKYVAGAISGSVAIMADASNSLSDAGSCIIAFCGFKLAGKKPDLDHPYGHGRMEYIAGLGVALLILLMGVELMHMSYHKIKNPGEVLDQPVVIAILVISMLVKCYMAYFNSRVGKKVNSQTMITTAKDSMFDVVSTGVALGAILLSRISSFNFDGYGGGIVSLFIIWGGIGAIKEMIDPLIGQTPKPEFIAEIEKTVLDHEEVLGIHDMRVHDYGPGRVMISLHAEVSGDENIYAIHDVIDRIEVELYTKYNVEAVIHMDPIDIHDEHIAERRGQVTQMVKEINESFSIHDFRMVPGTTHTNLVFDLLVPVTEKRSDQELKDLLQEKIATIDPTYHVHMRVDRG